MKKRGWVVILLAALALNSGGCRIEEGIAEGLTDGFSAAVAALIETPVNYWLDQHFE